MVRTAGVEPALGQLTEARNREKPNLLPCANIRIDCRFFRLSGCVGNPAPALSHIGLRGVAVPSCHILSFLNTSGWLRMGATQHCPVFLKRRAGHTFSEVSGLSHCQASLTSALPPCAVVRATAPLVFPHTVFSPEKPLSKTMKTFKNAGFSLPGSRRDDLPARRRHAEPESRGAPDGI